MLAVKRILRSNEGAFGRYTKALTSMINKMTARPETQGLSWGGVLKQGNVSIHSSACLSGGNKLKKMMSKKKKRWYESPVQTSALQAGFLKPSKRNKQESVRMRTLNTIIYKAVVDLLSSYEVDSEVNAYNVQISKVSLTPDFSACRIYWKTSLSAEQDSHIQQALNKCASRIRHLLISHQILGNVPPVVFIRDKQYAAVTEIENLLKKADFGPEEDNINHLSTTNVGARLQLMESEDNKKPVLFGVDHEALHKQIEAYKREKGARDSLTQSPAAGGLTQEQLDMLADIRKQKLVEKKKKSKWMKDNDITAKDFLLSRILQKEEKDCDEDSLEDSQVTEWMEEDNKTH